MNRARVDGGQRTGNATRPIDVCKRAMFNSGRNNLGSPSGPMYAYRFSQVQRLYHNSNGGKHKTHLHTLEYIRAVLETRRGRVKLQRLVWLDHWSGPARHGVEIHDEHMIRHYLNKCTRINQSESRNEAPSEDNIASHLPKHERRWLRYRLQRVRKLDCEFRWLADKKGFEVSALQKYRRLIDARPCP